MKLCLMVVSCGSFLVLFLSSCVTERTVTNESGDVLLKETVVNKPFESEAEKQAEVQEELRQHGW
ncbi:hypothetical protein [Persicirhabdus sediminis]|uniref:Lipoprotein n=1 Tax=Persicirhabdus sediminis TaxID=454144 RepID=A0A8J7SK24_9BACT|nr:hypothetical protein [Persicirhabdus sediminis]MBK1791744.1 hypothetical protein [Persicirhabdus sediminis]